MSDEPTKETVSDDVKMRELSNDSMNNSGTISLPMKNADALITNGSHDKQGTCLVLNILFYIILVLYYISLLFDLFCSHVKYFLS